MNIEKIIEELSKLKTYDEAHHHLTRQLGFEMRRYGDLDELIAQATYVGGDFVIYLIYKWIKIGANSYISGDMIKVKYNEIN